MCICVLSILKTFRFCVEIANKRVSLIFHRLALAIPIILDEKVSRSATLALLFCPFAATLSMFRSRLYISIYIYTLLSNVLFYLFSLYCFYFYPTLSLLYLPSLSIFFNFTRLLRSKVYSRFIAKWQSNIYLSICKYT